MTRIRIIIPYFGRLPATFPFWYVSAKNNPDVDFLFLTDCEVEECKNICVVKTTLEEIKTRYEKILGMEITIPAPYKLCEFRPAYGMIFAEELEGYDFWGFGDIDLVYGRIRDFITEDVLSRYDIISGWGHLTLYRNCEFCNSFYLGEHEGFSYYKDCFTVPETRCFDEYPLKGLSSAWDALYPEKVYHCESDIDDIIIQSECRHFRSGFAVYRHSLTFIYEDRNLFRIYYDKGYHRHKEPTLYAHFQKRYNWKVETDDCSRYIIYPNVFHKPFRHLLYLKLMLLGSSKTSWRIKK